ncbi:uncharacterized protein LOC119642177 [Glossina fuscipes]|uniref:Uncharacterized protein LOC119642177 n=1 Tax=Glossina fuscipes TaxID=7396 RepID=A0A9C5ZAR7_9MUSC|nr:uncharacterized protein LOC119642177 [Glossina fuscipes]KAI9589182.1 hypothetical protein GQX74_007351 [Glossina fuscipes]
MIRILVLICINILAIGAKPMQQTPFDELVNNAIKNFYGMHCVSEVIVDVSAAAGDFAYDLELCEDPYTVDDFTDILDTKDVINRITDRLLVVNELDCDNHQYLPDWNGSTIPSRECLTKFKKHLNKMNFVIEETINEILVAGESNVCALMAMGKYVIKLDNFTGLLQACAEVAEKFNK